VISGRKKGSDKTVVATVHAGCFPICVLDQLASGELLGTLMSVSLATQ